MTSPTNPGDPDIVGLVRSLTKAQREALLNATCAVPAWNEERALDCICASEECDSLEALGLAEQRIRWPNGIIRTPLGLRVRQHLLDNPS